MSIDQDESSQVIRIVYLAKLAEQAERYDEMVSSMKEVVEKKQGNLDVEQRNLLSVAYKNVIGARRASWRILSSLEQKCRDASETTDPKRIQEIEGYRKEVEEELNRICDDVLEVIDKKVMPNIGEDADEARVFFLKMKGDYYRYIAEFSTGNERDKASKNSKGAYEDASEAAKKLQSTHPIRLGLALNYSVFHYEIDNNPQEACKIAKEAFDTAITELDQLQEDQYKDSTLIMQLLRDNLTLWTSDLQDEREEGTTVQDLEQ